MAMAVKHIIVSCGIILHTAAGFIGQSSGYGAAALIYLFVLGMNFFIGSATANAVLLIALGVAGISWIAWFKRTWALQLATLVLTMGLLMLAVFPGYH